jgi:hypothetical protein
MVPISLRASFVQQIGPTGRARSCGVVIDPVRSDAAANHWRVTGTYPLYGGRIEGTVRVQRLEGTWSEGEHSGRFLFVLGRSGNSFNRRFDTGEWWTGARGCSDRSTGLRSS